MIPKLRKYEFKKTSVELNKKNISGYDLVLLSTDHSYYDYKFIFENANIIVDTRNAFKKFKGKNYIKRRNEWMILIWQLSVAGNGE